MTPLDRVLDALRAHGCDPRRNGAGWSSKCPAHDDRVASLTASEGATGHVLVKCHAGDGCAFAEIASALGLPETAFFPPKRRDGGRPRKTYFVYADENGEPLFRVVRTAGKKFWQERYNGSGWTKGLGDTPRVLYRLPEIMAAVQASRWVLVVEGEKHCDRLAELGVVATSSPMGAGKWQGTYAAVLRGAKVAVLPDNDDDGRDHADDVVTSLRGLAAIVKLVELDGLPPKGDVLDWLEAGHTVDELKQAVRDAPEWQPDDAVDRVSPVGDEPVRNPVSTLRTPATAPPPPAEPPELARNPQILNVFRRDVRRRGVAGEVVVASTLYLVVTSRLLGRQVSAAVKGHTSSGKSHTVEKVLEFFPAEAFVPMTAMSEHALVYLDEDLKHRTLVLYEAVALREGQEENHTAYFVRSLLSEGHIRYPVVVRDKSSGEYVTRWVIKEGPTNLVVTTTRTRVHAENETRLLSFSTDDSKEQTKRVMAEIASESDSAADVDLDEWRRLQAWLASAEHRVTIPYAGRLAELVPPVAVRLRRDFGALLALIRAHAVLHQLSRERDDAGRVVAAVADYAVVRDLVADVLAEGVGSTVSDTVRETVEVVERLSKAYEAGVPASAVAKALDLDKSAARRRCIACGDYLVNQEERRGRPGRWVVGDPLPESTALLPEPSQLDAELAVPPPPEMPTASPPEYEAAQGETAGGGAVAGAFRGVREAACPWCGAAGPLGPSPSDPALLLCAACAEIAREGREEV